MTISKGLSRIRKKAEKNVLHPNGLRMKKLQRAMLRDEHIAGDKAIRAKAKSRQLDRFIFFQQIISDSDQKTYDISETREFIEKYINRHSEGDTKPKRDYRRSSVSQSRQQLAIDEEKAEFREGFTVPDLADADTVKWLKSWNHTPGGLNMIKITRVAQEQPEKNSLMNTTYSS